MTITYNDINDNTKLIVADILSKRESIESELANIQTERAQMEVGFSKKEEELKTEKNKLIQDIRNIRKATLIVSK